VDEFTQWLEILAVDKEKRERETDRQGIPISSK